MNIYNNIILFFIFYFLFLFLIKNKNKYLYILFKIYFISYKFSFFLITIQGLTSSSKTEED